ncbi:uncharacterized protein N7469_001622 [Penicillium citrinum]|uniref:Uncharacterized protein n=1 Tax=Penicillium citrinum TaxID=5077 RepID=A0A9W9TXR6_PENCI|nr:uncharacterized protein N7469_001622 [Penicillium citrinum]KAJ5243295.1 hypothetical protein N7469_001622 [Penicillium citrinum]
MLAHAHPQPKTMSLYPDKIAVIVIGLHFLTGGPGSGIRLRSISNRPGFCCLLLKPHQAKRYGHEQEHDSKFPIQGAAIVELGVEEKEE